MERHILHIFRVFQYISKLQAEEQVGLSLVEAIGAIGTPLRCG